MKRRRSGTNAQCVLSELPVRKARPQARRDEHRQPSRSFMPTHRVAGGSATCHYAGAAGLDAGAVAIARSNSLSLRRQNGGPGGRPQGHQGVDWEQDRSLTTKSQTSLRMATLSESDQFHGTQCSECWPGSRLCRGLGRHAQHRAHNATALAGRSLAAFGAFSVGCDRAVLTVSAVCSQRNERSRSLLHL